MKRLAAVSILAALAGGLAFTRAVDAAQPETLQVRPGGYVIVSGIGPETVMAAYQRPYAMNFEVWKPLGLPAGWYATFDGFPVAQVAENRWVYGQMGIDGAIIPTDILVGSVVPADVPALVRVAAEWGYSGFLNDPKFRKILEYRCDRMGYLNDPMMRTAIAWNSQRPGAWIWLADHWMRIDTQPGEYTWQALLRRRLWIAGQLREKEFWGLNSVSLADLARQWGLLWEGSLSIRSLEYYRDSGGGERDNSVQTATTNNNNDNSGGNWDVD